MKIKKRYRVVVSIFALSTSVWAAQKSMVDGDMSLEVQERLEGLVHRQAQERKERKQAAGSAERKKTSQKEEQKEGRSKVDEVPGGTAIVGSVKTKQQLRDMGRALIALREQRPENKQFKKEEADRRSMHKKRRERVVAPSQSKPQAWDVAQDALTTPHISSVMTTRQEEHEKERARILLEASQKIKFDFKKL